MKPSCKKVILVEGKYDKIRLESCLDATVITTEGFGIFRDSEKKALLRRLAENPGLVMLLDSDGAGKLIRSHVRTVCGEKKIIDLYVPPIPGKERRKSTKTIQYNGGINRPCIQRSYVHRHNNTNTRHAGCLYSRTLYRSWRE